MKQSISCYTSFFLKTFDLKVISKSFLSLVNLIKIQVFYIHKLIEIIGINKDLILYL